MFHNTHLYVASKLYKSNDPLLLVGSFLPDLAVTKIIKWEGGLHGAESDDKFNQFIYDKFPEYSKLAEGIHAHNILDDFTHKDYHGSGYAYQNNEDLVKLVIEYYGLSEERAISKAHNFIETGVDILLLKKRPETQLQLKKAVEAIDKDRLSIILSSYFKIDSQNLLSAISFFFDQFTTYDLTQEQNWNIFWEDLEKLFSLPNIGFSKRQKLLNISVDIVQNTYQNFLEYSLNEGSEKLSRG